MTQPAFIRLPNGDLVATANLRRVRRERNALLIEMNDGLPPVIASYPSTALAHAALEYFDSQLMGEPSLLAMSPSTVIHIMGGGGPGSQYSIYGQNFSNNSPAIVLYVHPLTGAAIACTTSYVSQTELEITLPVGLAIGSYDVVYSDGNGASVTLSEGLEIVTASYYSSLPLPI